MTPLNASLDDLTTLGKVLWQKLFDWTGLVDCPTLTHRWIKLHHNCLSDSSCHLSDLRLKETMSDNSCQSDIHTMIGQLWGDEGRAGVQPLSLSVSLSIFKSLFMWATLWTPSSRLQQPKHTVPVNQKEFHLCPTAVLNPQDVGQDGKLPQLPLGGDQAKQKQS